MIEVQEVLEYIEFEANDYLVKDTKIEGDRVVSNHQRFIDVSKGRNGTIGATPGISWPYDTQVFLDYGETKFLPESADEDELADFARHFAEYLNAWQQDFDFPREIVEEIMERVEDDAAGDVEVKEVDIDGSTCVESCGSGVSIEFQEFEGSGFYYISTYHRNDDGKPEDRCDHDYQDSLEGYELADAERKSDVAAKYANWLIGEINAASEA